MINNMRYICNQFLDLNKFELIIYLKVFIQQVKHKDKNKVHNTKYLTNNKILPHLQPEYSD